MTLGPFTSWAMVWRLLDYLPPKQMLSRMAAAMRK